jgi:riboflavin synthase
MFTGIIEAQGTVHAIETEGGNFHFYIRSELGNSLKIDQSLAHNGVCLTVVGIDNDIHKVTAVAETLKKSSLGSLVPGSKVNLERSMQNNGRFDGHIVQGHVDQVASCSSIEEQEGSWEFTFDFLPGEHVLVEKGSVCVDGISLTCFAVSDNSFKVAIIPYTFDNTNFGQLKAGDIVNLEFDIIGKYVQRLMERV